MNSSDPARQAGTGRAVRWIWKRLNDVIIMCLVISIIAAFLGFRADVPHITAGQPVTPDQSTFYRIAYGLVAWAGLFVVACGGLVLMRSAALSREILQVASHWPRRFGLAVIWAGLVLVAYNTTKALSLRIPSWADNAWLFFVALAGPLLLVILVFFVAQRIRQESG